MGWRGRGVSGGLVVLVVGLIVVCVVLLGFWLILLRASWCVGGYSFVGWCRAGLGFSVVLILVAGLVFWLGGFRLVAAPGFGCAPC